MKAISICLFFFFIVSCSQKNNEPQQVPKILPATKSAKKFSIKYVASVLFDKSYSFLMDQSRSEKEIERMCQEMDRSNQTLLEGGKADSVIYEFEQFGFVKGNELLVNKFKFRSRENVLLKNSPFADVEIRFARISSGKWKLFTVDKTDTISFPLGYAMELKYALFDIRPACKLLVILDESHISNNDLWNFVAYEIKMQSN